MTVIRQITFFTKDELITIVPANIFAIYPYSFFNVLVLSNPEKDIYFLPYITKESLDSFVDFYKNDLWMFNPFQFGIRPKIDNVENVCQFLGLPEFVDRYNVGNIGLNPIEEEEEKMEIDSDSDDFREDNEDWDF